jgi:hypothetical protein
LPQRPFTFRQVNTYFALLSLCLLFGDNLAAGQEKIFSIDDVVKSWRAREKLAKTLLVKWEGQVVTAPLHDEVKRELVMTYKESGQEVPKDLGQEEIYQDIWVTKLSEGKWRTEHEEKGRNAGWEKQISTYNSGTLKTFMPEGTAPSHPLGNIHKSGFHNIGQVINVRPLFLIYRAFSAKLFDPEDFSPLPKMEMVKNNLCLVLKSKSQATTLWLSPDMDFSVLRYAYRNEQAHIDYKKDSRYGWVPVKWSVIRTGPRDQFSQSATSEVTEVRFNVAFDAKEFDLDFPVGTWVRDWTKPSELGDNTQYIVRAGGEKRFVMDAEIPATYQELVTTESGQAKRAKDRSPLPNLVAGAVLVLAAAFFIYQKARKRA